MLNLPPSLLFTKTPTESHCSWTLRGLSPALSHQLSRMHECRQLSTSAGRHPPNDRGLGFGLRAQACDEVILFDMLSPVAPAATAQSAAADCVGIASCALNRAVMHYRALHCAHGTSTNAADVVQVSELRQWPALRELEAAAVRDTLLPFFRLTWVEAFEVLYSKGAAISAPPSDVKLHLLIQVRLPMLCLLLLSVGGGTKADMTCRECTLAGAMEVGASVSCVPIAELLRHRSHKVSQIVASEPSHRLHFANCSWLWLEVVSAHVLLACTAPPSSAAGHGACIIDAHGNPRGLVHLEAGHLDYAEMLCTSEPRGDSDACVGVQGTVVKGVPAGQLPAGAAGGGMDEISRMIVTRTVRARQQDSAVLLGTEALVCRTYPATVIAKCVPVAMGPSEASPFTRGLPIFEADRHACARCRA